MSIPQTQQPRSMASRPLIIASLLGASVGVPYAVSNLPKDGGGISWPFANSSSSNSQYSASAMKTPEQLRLPIDSPGSQIYSSPAPLEGAPMLSIEHLLRFDLNKEWVYRNWARKSTGMSFADLFGVRVPVVTGTSMADIAGSLTYYFDANGQVQHITFTGRTGDTSRLIAFLTRNYKFQRTASPAGEQLFQVTGGGGVLSELRTRPESVLWATAPHGSFAVELELARPGSKRTLAPRIASAEK
jgi:hypothetical protein